MLHHTRSNTVLNVVRPVVRERHAEILVSPEIINVTSLRDVHVIVSYVIR